MSGNMNQSNAASYASGATAAMLSLMADRQIQPAAYPGMTSTPATTSQWAPSVLFPPVSAGNPIFGGTTQAGPSHALPPPIAQQAWMKSQHASLPTQGQGVHPYGVAAGIGNPTATTASFGMPIQFPQMNLRPPQQQLQQGSLYCFQQQLRQQQQQQQQPQAQAPVNASVRAQSRLPVDKKDTQATSQRRHKADQPSPSTQASSAQGRGDVSGHHTKRERTSSSKGRASAAERGRTDAGKPGSDAHTFNSGEDSDSNDSNGSSGDGGDGDDGDVSTTSASDDHDDGDDQGGSGSNSSDNAARSDQRDSKARNRSAAIAPAAQGHFAKATPAPSHTTATKDSGRGAIKGANNGAAHKEEVLGAEPPTLHSTKSVAASSALESNGARGTTIAGSKTAAGTAAGASLTSPAAASASGGRAAVAVGASGQGVRRKGTACPDCGKMFRHAAWMRKHRVKHETEAKLLCNHPGCDKKFKSQTALRRHVRTQHENVYTYRCPICNKGFQDRRKLTAHHRSHERQEGQAQQAASAVLGQQLIQRMEMATAAAVVSAQQRVLAGMSAAAGSSACVICSSSQNVPGFRCCSCQMLIHWQCLGVVRPPEHDFPNTMCPACLQLRGLSPASLLTAVTGYQMLEQYMHQRAFRFAGVTPDPWSLITAVARGADAPDRQRLFRDALSALARGLPLDSLQPSEQASVRHAAQQALGQTYVLVNQTANPYYGTPLWDAMPAALASVVGKPLHIFQSDVSLGQVRLFVENDTSPGRHGDAQDGITLMRAGSEYQSPFYDVALPVFL